ncbi:hypothetical protein LSTR_LSTR012537 [Laodelphax striatellus]|uniref:Ribosomal RNA-processing protein 14/surfeit locus protein 6 C-terminal domain-containing protein n=1 Tax=Laodelphax striatellus TaxID=195883 RepID=A0A482XKY0_LAOST|nr:hypothetical protein LSTR_LSTR012537 [Laodelphax striatellus]
MTLSANNNGITFNKKKLRKILTESYRFVSNLEKYCNFPDQVQTEVSDDEREERKVHKEETLHDKQNKPIVDVKKRLRGLEEIEMKLKEIKGKKLKDIKDIRYKKNLKTRLNKQKKVAAFKQDKETKKQKKMLEKQKRKEALENKEGGERTEETSNNEQKDKIIFNKDSKMVFNKIDFTGLGKEKKNSKGKKGKIEKDPKQLLENVKKSNSEIKSLEESGEVAKAKKIKEKHMWMSALKRAEGVKVKDDVDLLKKTVRKQTQLKNQRKKKWEARVHAVEKKKEERQQKRTDNIAARKKEKKKNKIKKSVKKGRIVL